MFLDSSLTEQTMVEQHAEFVCEYIISCCDDSDDDIILVFDDGQVTFKKLLLFAVSEIRNILEDCDIIIIESSQHIGQLLSELLLKGKRTNLNQETVKDLQKLLKLLNIDIDLIVENISDSMPELTKITHLVLQEEDPRTVTEIKPEKKMNLKSGRNRLFECDICFSDTGNKFQFESLTSLRRHTMELHKAKPLMCPEASKGCKFRADDVTKLSNHVHGVHKSVYSENISCDICLKSFPSVYYLNNHIKRMHKVQKSQREKCCPYCGEKKLQLNDHIMRVHKVKKYFCDYCPKSFKTNVQRRIHHNVHTGFKPYTCASCSLTFSRLHHRKIHLEKFGHTPGPVLKPDDHVDFRSLKKLAVKDNIADEHDKERLLDIVDNLDDDDDVRNINSEQLKQEIGVSCAEIIENITLSTVNFEDFD